MNRVENQALSFCPRHHLLCRQCRQEEGLAGSQPFEPETRGLSDGVIPSGEPGSRDGRQETVKRAERRRGRRRGREQRDRTRNLRSDTRGGVEDGQRRVGANGQSAAPARGPSGLVGNLHTC